VARHRGIESETVKIDDPLVQRMARLRTTWQFEVIKAVRFAYQGERGLHSHCAAPRHLGEREIACYQSCGRFIAGWRTGIASC